MRRISAGVSAVVAPFCWGILVLASRSANDPAYVCQHRTLPQLPASVGVEGGRGARSWGIPTGLTCTYPTERGGPFVTHPDAWLSVVLVVALVATLFALASVLRALRKARRSRGSAG